ncbi:MAG: GlsB/YeaQ/YmgE family stress response membrane protein [Acholeplasmataceae bacterium]
MYILLWIFFGAIIGWLASILTNDNHRMGILANIVVGLVGSVIGGFIANLFGWGTVMLFSWQGALFAILGAVILLTIINSFNKRKR